MRIEREQSAGHPWEGISPYRSLLRNPVMGLRDVTRAIIAKVEHVTGHPVLVNEDRSLRTLYDVAVK